MSQKLFRVFLLSIAVSQLTTVFAQPDRWQQRIKYNINVAVDVATNRFKGTEKLEYTNNSPDTLDKVYFHLYWNAFQPGSSMDVRSRELGKIQIAEPLRNSDGLDWDARVKDRISKLTPDQIGYQRVSSIRIAGVEQQLKEHETILEVILSKPILPKSKVQMDVVFEAQVPLQIRRSGRDNAEGIRYSMSQWYPKMVEYDYQGWNANPYIAREFYGVWGDFDVNITIDKSYMVTAGGDLMNANEVGFGYQAPGTVVKPATGNTLTWKWQAYNVHDFMWAADPSYKMITRAVKDGPLIRVVYKAVDSLENRWQKMADTAALAYPIIAKTFGAYPYKTYTFIQGGDGGMEYPMGTLLKSASVGTAIHEWMHSWYQMMMGSNESLYPWMDEGFTDYASTRVLATLRNSKDFWYTGSYRGYFALAKSGYEEPASTHADHYNTNYAYASASYSKGALFLSQLGYIVSDSVRDKILLAYYNQWRFKHPNPNDFVRVAEKQSGMELDWFKEYWINSTKTIDYGVGDIAVKEGKTMITIRRIGKMPMPVDVLLTFKDGSKELHYIPLNLMYGEKPAEDATPRTVHEEWKWTHPEYSFATSRGIQEIRSIEIDPSQRLADVNRINNKLVIPD
ncbi:MAG: M1 family metallopeptidase [Chitinophagaceae bacterium]|nr:M1 family metallopeptidase [Chitinophagaceae bacterium]MCA6452894.1 M1 family metallopeptidase [Chitinophagaceae bacterium]MCA6456313.1 M1 family metallopeptidase [Chitinophagaceae bacterium]MCA6460215.1 M1 family metallopeptidase [Chitinophagaceae bacterium]MCA6466036.1 M1 family metallopeptidase [Chitinophagaceae bacterium]